MTIRSLSTFFARKPWLRNEANENLLVNSGADLHSLEALEAASARLNLGLNKEYANGWLEYTTKHPEHENLANMYILFSKIQPEEVPSLEAFENIASSLQQPLSINAQFQHFLDLKAEAQRRLREEDAERARFIKLLAHGAEQYSARDSQGRRQIYDTVDLETLDMNELRKWTANILEQRRLENTPKEDLKKAIDKKMGADWNAKIGAAYPVFPRQLCLPGDVHLTTIDKTFLRRCQPELLRKYVRIYGNEAVNNRLNGIE